MDSELLLGISKTTFRHCRARFFSLFFLDNFCRSSSISAAQKARRRSGFLFLRFPRHNLGHPLPPKIHEFQKREEMGEHEQFREKRKRSSLREFYTVQQIKKIMKISTATSKLSDKGWQISPFQRNLIRRFQSGNENSSVIIASSLSPPSALISSRR